MESRHGNQVLGGQKKAAALPVDFTRMVKDVFSRHFDQGLKRYAKIKPDPSFEADGYIFPNEIVVAVSLVNKGHLAATTLHLSCDYDPKASTPTAEELLAACIDAAGTLFDQLFDEKKPERLEQMADESLSALENVPFEWTKIEVDRFKIFVKIDKANPKLDQLTDEWLAKNDPEAQSRLEEEARETEKLFVTGKKKPDHLH